MNRWRQVLIVCLAMVRVAAAQDHLEPDAGVLVHPDSYLLKVRDVFARTFDRDVTVRAVVVPSFRNEFVVGLRETKEGHETFVARASSSIWDTELVSLFEQGKHRGVDREGKPVPLEQNPAYLQLKKRTPTDHRRIKADWKARPIPVPLAERIETLWHRRLLDVRYPKERIDGTDGITYHFSAWIQGRGDLSGHVWSPEPDSKTGRFVALVEAMAEYANGKMPLEKLTEHVDRAAAQ